jgi:hypothetical protein
MQNRSTEADALFAELLAHEAGVESQFTRARLHLFYGQHLMNLRRFEDAERELETAAKCVGDIRRGTWDTHPDDVIVAFIALYDAWGMPERAREYQRLRDQVIESRRRDDAGGD